MKRCLLLFGLIPSISFGQIRADIEFVTDNDTFPDCHTHYVANGTYTIHSQALIDIKLPNTIKIEPSTLLIDSSLVFHSFGRTAAHLGSIDVDEYQFVPVSSTFVDSILQRNVDYYWSSKRFDETYLFDHFGIIVMKTPEPVSELLPEPIEDEIGIRGGFSPFSSGILAGVYIPDVDYFQLRNREHSECRKALPENSSEMRQQQIQPLLDSLLRPFYFSNYEVTNREYREFINWVKDSVEAEIAYTNLMSEDAVQLLNCSRKERKNLDALEQAASYRKYGLDPAKKSKIDPLKWAEATVDFYYPLPQRYYKRREVDVYKLRYSMPDTIVSIYPDTLLFNDTRLGSWSTDFLEASWHPIFENYPIVNVNYHQIRAFCHWKQRRMNEQFASEGYKITVRPPTITEYEFATKTTLGRQGYRSALDQPNDSFILNERNIEKNSELFYTSVYFDPTRPSKQKMKPIEIRGLHYKQWYQANMSESPVKFLNGNVSEIVVDDVTHMACSFYGVESDEDPSTLYFVLGSNYSMDVKTHGDDQYNALFYKTVLKKNEASPLVGFRLIYIIE